MIFHNSVPLLIAAILYRSMDQLVVYPMY